MTRKIIIILLSCFLSATALIVTLYALSDKIVHQPGNFLRVYQKDAAIKSNDLDMGINSYYIAGISDDKIYLGNLTTPHRLLMTNITLTDSQHVKISFKDPKILIYPQSKIKIAHPYFYYVDGITPCLLRGKIGEWKAERFMYDTAYFDHSEVIGPYSFAIRTRNTAIENVLGKVQNSKPHITLGPTLLQKQIDGIFCTDGMLRYNNKLNRLIYTYYYRNEYIVYDTNLTLDYRGHTIDTFSRAQIKTAYVRSTKTHIATSRKFTNKESCTSGNYLFISSNLLAKNDLRRMFDMMSIIDVYDLRDNTYKFSFSLPHYDEQNKLREFRVHKEKFLIAVYGNYLVKYDLQSRYFND